MRPHNTRSEALGARPTPAQPAAVSEPRITALEARVKHLEAALEGLQDAVSRNSLTSTATPSSTTGRTRSWAGEPSRTRSRVPSAKTRAGTELTLDRDDGPRCVSREDRAQARLAVR